MERRFPPIVLAIAAIGIVAFLVLGQSLSGPDSEPEDGSAIEQVEITEYEGQPLGSVDDFRENSIAGVQEVDPATYALVIDGLVEQSASYALEELADFNRTRKLVTIHCVEGWTVTGLWEGIALTDLLERVTPLTEANTVIFHAVDGYTTSLPIEFVYERNLIIADRINEIELPPQTGYPFILVAEDKWGYKWIRWLSRIELSDDPEYRGFWEERGFNNDGDVNGPRTERGIP